MLTHFSRKIGLEPWNWRLYKVRDCFLGLLHLISRAMAYPLQPRTFHSQAHTWPCCLHPLGAPTHLHLSDSAKDIAMPDSYDIMQCHKIYMHHWFAKDLVHFHETFRDHRLSLKRITMPFLLVTLPSLHCWKETKLNVAVHLPCSTVKMKYAWLKTTAAFTVATSTELSMNIL